MDKSVARYDKGDISKTIVTDEGYIRGQAIVTRTGVFLYKNADGTVRRELRHPDDVLEPISLASMKMIPVTDGHPSERLVTAENAKRLAVGYTGETVTHDSKYIYSNLTITDSYLVEKIKGNRKNELSLGYTVDLDQESGVYGGEEYDFRQKNIRYNHLAVVDEARAGPKARIALDGLDAVEISKEETMTKKSVKIDEEEFLLEPEVAESVEEMIKAKDAEIDRLKEELEKVMAERDTLKERGMIEEAPALEVELSPKMDSAEISSMINKRVNERLRLIKAAEPYLGKEAKIDGMSDTEIQKAVILADQPKANLDGKSEIYIQARFDSILENPKASAQTSIPTKIDAKDSSRADLDARQAMIQRLKKGA